MFVVFINVLCFIINHFIWGKSELFPGAKIKQKLVYTLVYQHIEYVELSFEHV